MFCTVSTTKEEDRPNENIKADVIINNHASPYSNINSSSDNRNVEEEEEDRMKIKPSYSTTPSLHSILSRDKKGALADSFSSSVQPSDDDYVINLIENIEIPTQENLKVI